MTRSRGSVYGTVIVRARVKEEKNWRTLEQNTRCKDTLVVTNRECKTCSSYERMR